MENKKPTQNFSFNPKSFAAILKTSIEKDLANGIFTKQQATHLLKEIDLAVKSINKNAKSK